MLASSHKLWNIYVFSTSDGSQRVTTVPKPQPELRPLGGRRFPGATCAVFSHTPGKSQQVPTVPTPQPELGPLRGREFVTYRERVKTQHRWPRETLFLPQGTALAGVV